MGLVALVGTHLTRRQIQRSTLERTAADARLVAELHLGEASEDLVETFRQNSDLQYVRFEIEDRSTDSGSVPETDRENPFADLTPSETRDSRVETRRFADDPYGVAVTTGTDEGRPWRAIALKPLGEADRRLAEARKMLLAYLGIDALFILVVGYAFLTYLVVRPIRAIGVATRRAARGDLASHIDLLPANEFGRVGRSFNRMLDELRDNRRELEDRLEELDAAYRELEQTQESLIRSEKLASVGQLAAGVAHEIGNPLSAISGYLDLLDDPELEPEKRRDILDRMQNQVERIQTIIRDLLDYSRSDSEFPIESVDLASHIQEAVDLLAPQPTAREIDVDVRLPDDLPPVRANGDQTVQVLVNLLMNAAEAIDAADAPGRIEIDSDADSETVTIRIVDDGPGIPASEQARIFDPFYTTKETEGGTGLGLAITDRIMERFDGEVSVESEPGAGATFALTFPRARISEEQT